MRILEKVGHNVDSVATVYYFPKVRMYILEAAMYRKEVYKIIEKSLENVI